MPNDTFVTYLAIFDSQKLFYCLVKNNITIIRHAIWNIENEISEKICPYIANIFYIFMGELGVINGFSWVIYVRKNFSCGR